MTISLSLNTETQDSLQAVPSSVPIHPLAVNHPPAIPSTSPCPACTLGSLHICTWSSFALCFASLQLHCLDSVLPFSGLRAQNSASTTERCSLLKCSVSTRKVQVTERASGPGFCLQEELFLQDWESCDLMASVQHFLC